MSEKATSIKSLPPKSKIVSARGHRKNGKGINIVKYRFGNQEFTAWIPIGGGAA